MTDLIQVFGDGQTVEFPEFRPQAGYFAAMDCLIYLNEDASYRAIRLSPWITVLAHPTEDRAIGVKIKGFRSVIEQGRAILRAFANTDLTEPQVMLLLTVLEVAFTASLGERATSEAEAARRQQWSARVRQLAREAAPLTLAEFTAFARTTH